MKNYILVQIYAGMKIASSLTMSKMATLFVDKKTAKTLQVIYFSAKTNEPLQPKTKLNKLTKKVYKKREGKTGGENNHRNDRLDNIAHRKPLIRIHPSELRGHQNVVPERATSNIIRIRKDPSTTGVSIRSDLYGRHAVSVTKKTRQKVKNLAQPGQKVSNLTKNRRGKLVGRGVLPQPRSPDARSSVRLTPEGV
jgi:hypothetical protein